jgi:hypothetical protein
MAWIDELLQGRLKQIVLTIVARLAHGHLPSTANLDVEGIMGRQNRESQNARKPPPTPSFLAKPNTCSGQISPIDQAFQNSSRATKDKRSAGMAVLEQWGMVEPVLNSARASYQQLRSRPARWHRNRRQGARELDEGRQAA